MANARLQVSKYPLMEKFTRGRITKVVDYVAAVYCSCLPVPQWYAFLGNLWVSLPYLLLKLYIVILLVLRALSAVKQQLTSSHIGTRVSEEEVRGEDCAICFSPMTSGVKVSVLPARHPRPD